MIGDGLFFDDDVNAPIALGGGTAIEGVDGALAFTGDAIGGEGPQRWLTIDFTADPTWL